MSLAVALVEARTEQSQACQEVVQPVLYLVLIGRIWELLEASLPGPYPVAWVTLCPTMESSARIRVSASLKVA